MSSSQDIKYSVFLQTNRSYQEFANVMREVIYLAIDAEKVVQRYYPEFMLNPVMLDGQLDIVGTKRGQKCMIGFNYRSLSGFAHFIIYGIIYNVAKKYNIPMYFDGYVCSWNKDNYTNAFTLNIQKTLAQQDDGKKKTDISLCFWDLRNLFTGRFEKLLDKGTVF
jgi:hypothetical protein